MCICHCTEGPPGNTHVVRARLFLLAKARPPFLLPKPRQSILFQPVLTPDLLGCLCSTGFTAAQRTQLSPLSIEEFPPLSAQASPTSPTNKIFDRKNLVPLSPTSPSTTLRLEPSPVPADWRHLSNVRSPQGNFADNKASQGTRGERESGELQVEAQNQTNPVLDDWAQAFSTNAQASFTATKPRDSVPHEGTSSGTLQNAYDGARPLRKFFFLSFKESEQ